MSSDADDVYDGIFRVLSHPGDESDGMFSHVRRPKDESTSLMTGPDQSGAFATSTSLAMAT